MDWRLIAAIAAAVGSCGLAGAVAFAVFNDSSGQSAKAPQRSMLLAERGAGGSLGAAFGSGDPNSSPIVGRRNGSITLASLNPSDGSTQSDSRPIAPPIKITAPTVATPRPGPSLSNAPAGDAHPSSLKPDMTGVLTPGEIARIKVNLRLTPDQELLWPPVQSALSEMGRTQMAQVMRGQKPEISQADWPPQRLYFVAGPFIKSLRPEQKDHIRALCRSMGFLTVASLI